MTTRSNRRARWAHIGTVMGVIVALWAPSAALAQDRGFTFDLTQGEQGTVIKGEEHRPDFTVFIDRENLTKAYDLQLKETFLPKISEALKHPPF